MKKGRGDNRGYRLLNIYQRLQQGETLTKRELADRYQVSEKTVQRDIDELRDYLAGEQSYLEIAYARRRGATKSRGRALKGCTRTKSSPCARSFWRAGLFRRTSWSAS